MDVAERLNLSIGLTYAIRHLWCVFSTMTIQSSIGGQTIDGDEFEARRRKIMSALKSNNVYTRISELTPMSTAGLAYLYRIDNLVQRVGDRQFDADTKSMIGKILDDMERDLALLISTPRHVAAPTALVAKPEWQWDTGREQWFYWCNVDKVYKYQNGMWIRLDGSVTTAAEQSLESNLSELVAPMRQLNTRHVKKDVGELP